MTLFHEIFMKMPDTLLNYMCMNNEQILLALHVKGFQFSNLLSKYPFKSSIISMFVLNLEHSKNPH